MLNDTQVGQLATAIFGALDEVGWRDGERRAAIARGIRAWDEATTRARQRAEAALAGVSWALTYMGETLDILPTEADAAETKLKLIDDIFANRVPHFLTADDFDDRVDAYDQFRIIPIKEE